MTLDRRLRELEQRRHSASRQSSYRPIYVGWSGSRRIAKQGDRTWERAADESEGEFEDRICADLKQRSIDPPFVLVQRFSDFDPNMGGEPLDHKR